VQSVEKFAPSEQEIEQARSAADAAAKTAAAQAEPVRLRVSAADLTDDAIDDLKQMLAEQRGSAEVLVEIGRSDGSVNRLRLGEEYRVRHTPTLRAELEQVLAAPSAAAPAAVAVL
jgi:hypothetical protein